jgi:hypothetical protein
VCAALGRRGVAKGVQHQLEVAQWAAPLQWVWAAMRVGAREMEVWGRRESQWKGGGMGRGGRVENCAMT